MIPRDEDERTKACVNLIGVRYDADGLIVRRPFGLKIERPANGYAKWEAA